jgi:3D (Asp-Asp-Asp) domain-containing protein
MHLHHLGVVVLLCGGCAGVPEHKTELAAWKDLLTVGTFPLDGEREPTRRILIVEEKHERVEEVHEVRSIRMRVTAYCPCSRCCGRRARGITASGRSAWGTEGAAADWGLLRPGTKIEVPGYSGGPVEVDDRGGKIFGNRLDVRFQEHWEARQWGVQYLTVKVID